MEDTIKRYHGCYFRNRNGTRKLIDIATGDNCVCATVNPFWRPVKLKYLRGRHYDTRSLRKNFKKEIRDGLSLSISLSLLSANSMSFCNIKESSILSLCLVLMTNISLRSSPIRLTVSFFEVDLATTLVSNGSNRFS